VNYIFNAAARPVQIMVRHQVYIQKSGVAWLSGITPDFPSGGDF
jgi:hypothetical protein